MKTKQLFAVGMAALMLMGCGSSAGRIRFGAAGLGGMYQAFGDAFAKLAEEGEGTDPIEVRTTAGSAANIRLLSEDYVQMAIAQADMAEDAYAGTGVFADGETYTNFSTVAGLYTEACQVAVRADSEITSIEDLQGKTVSIGEAVSVSWYFHDYVEALAAGGFGTSAADLTGRTGSADVCFYVFCCFLGYGTGLRCSSDFFRCLRFWYGCNPKCHGQYAGVV